MNCCDDYYSHQLIPLTQASPPSVISPRHIINSTKNIDSSLIVNHANGMDNSQNHQYECIPEYLLTMTHRRHPSLVCHHEHPLRHRPSICSIPYATFSRSLLHSQGVTTTSTSDSSQCTCSSPPSATVAQEESSTPLLAPSVHKEFNQTTEGILMSSPKSMKIGWTRRYSSASTKRKSTSANATDQRNSFLSQFRKASVVQ